MLSANPFEFTGAVAPQRSSRQGIDYLLSYSHVFDHPKWLVIVALVAVSQFFIPIVGPIVVLGYEFEIVRSLIRRDRYYPEFDFGRFVDYLMAGIWPFLIQMLVGLLLVPVFFVGMFVFFITTAALAQGTNNQIIFLGALPVMGLLMLLGFAAISVVTTPLMLRAGLMRDFAACWDFAFVRDFISRVGWPTLMVNGFLVITGPIITVLGLLCFCVGVYAAGALVTLASCHLLWQLYDLYLARGGEPIPLPEDDVFDASVA